MYTAFTTEKESIACVRFERSGSESVTAMSMLVKQLLGERLVISMMSLICLPKGEMSCMVMGQGFNYSTRTPPKAHFENYPNQNKSPHYHRDWRVRCLMSLQLTYCSPALIGLWSIS